MNYPYSLEKGSRKYSCPNCGDKRSFTRYINNSTGEYLGDTIGRCDHEISCKYHLSPNQAGIDNLPSSEFLSGLPQKKELHIFHLRRSNQRLNPTGEITSLRAS